VNAPSCLTLGVVWGDNPVQVNTAFGLCVSRMGATRGQRVPVVMLGVRSVTKTRERPRVPNAGMALLLAAPSLNREGLQVPP
jgi:hypothetical protein